MSSVTLVMPAHNEGVSIFSTLQDISQKVATGQAFRIYVSEDGSSDNTRSEVLRARSEFTNIEIVLSEPSPRLGYSRAVQKGIENCKSEVIGFVDSDGQYDPAEFEALYKMLKPGTVVVGYRNPRKDSKLRIFYSKMFNLAYRFFGGPKLRDPSCPLIFAYKDEIESLSHIEIKLDYGFWWEFQTRLKHIGLVVVEIPVTHLVRKEGSTQVYKLKKMPKIVYSHLLGLARLRRELRNSSTKK